MRLRKRSISCADGERKDEGGRIVQMTTTQVRSMCVAGSSFILPPSTLHALEVFA
jgi:hypothetical protein